jgi:diaminopimelate epimerase
MLLNPHSSYDFEMKYYNADGRESSMCGNGARCLVKFAYDMGIVRDEYHFLAVDGPHLAEIDANGAVSVKMKDVKAIDEFKGDSILDTGSPHYVKMVTDVMELDVYHKGMDIRYSSDFAKDGINVDFVEQKRPDEIIVRTYERGVEDETLSCGTGVTASALANYHNESGHNYVKVTTKGGKLTVRFDRNADGSFENVWLCGPAVKVFQGTI